MVAGPSSAQLSVAELPSGTDVDYQLGGDNDPPAKVGIVSATGPSRPRRGATMSVTSTASRPSPTRSASGATPGAGPARRERPAGGRRGLGRDPARHPHAGQAQALADIVGGWIRGCGARRLRGDRARQPRLVHPQRRADQPSDRRCVRRRLAKHAHHEGLAAGQKNLAGFDGTAIGYDFAVAEECGRYDECQRVRRRLRRPGPDDRYRFEDFAETCTAYGATHAVVLRDRDLRPDGVHGWC